jgi:hypothetical protein
MFGLPNDLWARLAWALVHDLSVGCNAYVVHLFVTTWSVIRLRPRKVPFSIPIGPMGRGRLGLGFQKSREASIQDWVPLEKSDGQPAKVVATRPPCSHDSSKLPKMITFPSKLWFWWNIYPFWLSRWAVHRGRIQFDIWECFQGSQHYGKLPNFHQPFPDGS